MSGARPLRVAQVIGSVEGGRWGLSICQGLRDRGYDVVAVIPPAHGRFSERLEAARIPIVRRDLQLASSSPWRRRIRGTQRAWDAAHLLRAAGALAIELRRRRVDVVHTHIFNATIVGRIAAWLARVPIRIAHVPGPLHLESPVLRELDVRTQWMDHHLLGGSAYIERLYRELGVDPRRVSHTYYGPDLERFTPATGRGERVRADLGVPPGVPLVGQVAYFYPPTNERWTPPALRGRGLKGHSDFLEAARLVLAEDPGVRFALVGGGWGPGGEEHRSEMRALARALGVDHAVVFTGDRDDVPDVLAALDVSVQCSLSENLGGTIESLLMERPTIATRVGGMPESVLHERTGLLVEPRDPPALAAAMLRLLRDPDEASRLGKAGRERMLTRFTAAATVDEIDALYRRLAAERGLAGRLPRPATSSDPLRSAHRAQKAETPAKRGLRQ